MYLYKFEIYRSFIYVNLSSSIKALGMAL
jgi:hypothetical protein